MHNQIQIHPGLLDRLRQSLLHEDVSMRDILQQRHQQKRLPLKQYMRMLG